MTSIPSRTRSLRKPTAGISQYDRFTAPSSDMPPRDRILKAPERRGDESPVRSPSRLPQPPSSSIARPARPGSSSSNIVVSSIRPPPPRSGVSRPPLTSDNKTPAVRTGARTPTEPNSSRSVISRPPLTSDNKISSSRTGARTPTEQNTARSIVSRPPLASDNRISVIRSGAKTPTEPNTSLQRRPSINSRTATHSRNASANAVPLSSSIPPSSRSIHTRAASTITAPTAASHTRAASSVTASTAFSHTRASSSVTTSTTLRPSSQQSQTATVPNPALYRPAFNTLQQHFSPLKSLAPKPATASYLAPPSPSKLPSNQLISAETARLQTELLQLHLLHLSASRTLKEFRQSAENKLRGRFEDLRRENEKLLEQERDVQGRQNAAALKVMDEDGSNSKGWGLDEKVQALDTVLNGVWNISEGGGRYVRVVKKFERWIGGVEEILESRENDNNGLGAGTGIGEAVFVKSMEGNWKEDCEGLSRKLEGWQTQLRHLGHVGDGGESSLSLVVKGLNCLVRGMQQELAIMRNIELEVIRAEEEWIQSVIGGGDDSDDDGETPGAVWRAY